MFSLYRLNLNINQFSSILYIFYNIMTSFALACPKITGMSAGQL